MQAGFAAIDITPPLGTHKIGWLRDIVPNEVLDPLFARAAVFEHDGEAMALVQLDTLSIRWSTVKAIRDWVEAACGIPGCQVLVGATHNHCGPAVAETGDVPRDDEYLAQLTAKVVTVIGVAWAQREPAELGFNRVMEMGLSLNRRVLMRDGYVKTHGTYDTPEMLCLEGPIDPEVAVLAARRPSGELLGVVTNFAAHPTHHGGEEVFSSGWPGSFVQELLSRGLPGAVFLQGSCGNLHAGNQDTREHLSREAMANGLADNVERALETMVYSADWPIRGKQRTVQLPYRRYTEEEVAGTLPGIQRFIDPAIYDRAMPRLLERIRSRRTQPAEVQAIALGEVRFISIPGEYFVEFQLAIKQHAHPRPAIVAAYANGMVGYLPTEQAFEHRGYETTFAYSSRQAPEAGQLLQEAAIALLDELAIG